MQRMIAWGPRVPPGLLHCWLVITYFSIEWNLLLYLPVIKLIHFCTILYRVLCEISFYGYLLFMSFTCFNINDKCVLLQSVGRYWCSYWMNKIAQIIDQLSLFLLNRKLPILNTKTHRYWSKISKGLLRPSKSYSICVLRYVFVACVLTHRSVDIFVVPVVHGHILEVGVGNVEVDFVDATVKWIPEGKSVDFERCEVPHFLGLRRCRLWCLVRHDDHVDLVRLAAVFTLGEQVSANHMLYLIK